MVDIDAVLNAFEGLEVPEPEAGAVEVALGAAVAEAPTPVRLPGVWLGKDVRPMAALTKSSKVLPEEGALMALVVIK